MGACMLVHSRTTVCHVFATAAPVSRSLTQHRPFPSPALLTRTPPPLPGTYVCRPGNTLTTRTCPRAWTRARACSRAQSRSRAAASTPNPTSAHLYCSAAPRLFSEPSLSTPSATPLETAQPYYCASLYCAQPCSRSAAVRFFYRAHETARNRSAFNRSRALLVRLARAVPL